MIDSRMPPVTAPEAFAMKSLRSLLLAAAIALPAAAAGNPDSPEPPLPRDGEEACAGSLAEDASPYLEWNRQLLRLLEDLGQCLEAIHDEASATEAAPQVALFMQGLADLLGQEKALPVPSDELAAYVEEQLMDEPKAEELAERTYGKIFELSLDQDPPCYGSTALQEAIGQLLRSITGYE